MVLNFGPRKQYIIFVRFVKCILQYFVFYHQNASILSFILSLQNLICYFYLKIAICGLEGPIAFFQEL